MPLAHSHGGAIEQPQKQTTIVPVAVGLIDADNGSQAEIQYVWTINIMDHDQDHVGQHTKYDMAAN